MTGQPPPDKAWAERIRGDLFDVSRKAALCFRASTQPAQQTHRARRLLKDANALALFLEDSIGFAASRASRDVRSFRRELGDTRDLDVMYETLESFAPLIEASVVAALQERLGQRRERLEHGAIAPDGASLRRELTWLADEVKRWDLSAATREGLLAPLKRSYARALRRGQAAFLTASPVELHELRKALIIYRTQLSSLDVMWPKLVRAWCSEAQTLRDALGLLNDLTVFAAFVAEVAEGPIDCAPLASLIEQKRAKAMARAEPIFQRLFCERPKDMVRRLDAWMRFPKRPPDLSVALAELDLPAEDLPAEDQSPEDRSPEQESDGEESA